MNNTAICVPTLKTYFNMIDFTEALIKAWFQLHGILPQKKQIAIIYAQWAIETGQGSSCWNNNIGNVKYIPSKNPLDDENIQYMMLSNVWEILNGKKVIFQPPHPATWFRAFPTLVDGVIFHLNFLKNKKYKLAWAAVEEGDSNKFAHLLKEAHYYTASETDYAKAVSYYFNKFMKDLTFEKIIVELSDPKSIKEIAPIIIPKKENTSSNSILSKFVELFNSVIKK